MSLSISPGSPKFISDLFTLDENTSPLHNAVISHDLSHLRQLLSSSSYDVDVLDEYDRSPLIYSIFVGSFGCFELLLQFGANIHILDYESKSPLHWACQLGRVRIAKFILSKDYNINQRDADGRTALHHLAGHHSTKVMLMLLLIHSSNSLFSVTPLGDSCLESSCQGWVQVPLKVLKYNYKYFLRLIANY